MPAVYKARHCPDSGKSYRISLSPKLLRVGGDSSALLALALQTLLDNTTPQDNPSTNKQVTATSLVPVLLQAYTMLTIQ